MKKVVVIIAVVVIGAFMISCATSKAPSARGTVIVGAEGVPQPAWVYQTPTAADKHFENGYGLLSNQQNSMKRAEAEAKNKIAGWVSTNVEEVVITYLNDAGSGSDRQALDSMEVISRQVAMATLMGVTTEDHWVDLDGGVWVLSSIPLENVQTFFEPASEALAETFSPSAAADAANAKMKEAFAALLRGK
ncbi:MAG: hypothetical protein WC954_05470 [Sphaerochaeta sp.]